MFPLDMCACERCVDGREGRAENQIISFSQLLTLVYNTESLLSVFTATCFLQLGANGDFERELPK